MQRHGRAPGAPTELIVLRGDSYRLKNRAKEVLHAQDGG